MANNTDSGKKATPEEKRPVSLVLVLFCLFATICVAFNSLHKFRNGIPCLDEIIAALIIVALFAIHIWGQGEHRSLFITIASSVVVIAVILTLITIPVSETQKDVIWVVRDQDGRIETTSADQPKINIPRSFRFTVFKIPREIFVGVGITSYGLVPPEKPLYESYKVSLTLGYSAKDIEHLLDLPEYRFHPQKLHWEIKQKIHDQVYKALKDHTQRESITLNVIADAIQKLNTELGTSNIRIEGIELESSYKKNPPAATLPTPSPAPV